MDSNIPSKPAYGVYISQLVRIGHMCDIFFTRYHQLTCRLVKQGFLYDKLVTNFKHFVAGKPKFFPNSKFQLENMEDGFCLPTVAISSLSSKDSMIPILSGSPPETEMTPGHYTYKSSNLQLCTSIGKEKLGVEKFMAMLPTPMSW